MTWKSWLLSVAATAVGAFVALAVWFWAIPALTAPGVPATAHERCVADLRDAAEQRGADVEAVCATSQLTDPEGFEAEYGN